MRDLVDKELSREILFAVSEWLINLSAGWFGAVFIIPLFTEGRILLLLTINLPAAILGLIIAVILRRKVKRL